MHKSATKIVLIMFAGILCISMLYIVFVSGDKEAVAVGIVTLFTSSTAAVIGFYFKNSKTNSETENIENTKNPIS